MMLLICIFNASAETAFMKHHLYLLCILPGLITFSTAAGQTLTLKAAVDSALHNYPSIKVKTNYALAADAVVQQTKKEALPNFVISLQQDYGTINGQNGPAYGLGGFGVASSGAALNSQNWHAGFGGTYLSNINWDFFAFGRVKERLNTAKALATRDRADETQEIFQQQIKVASAYLNLLAAQRITRSQERNLLRADTIKFVVTARAKNGLIAGVDSSFANAEVSNAKSALIAAKDAEQERAGELAMLMGVPQRDFILDSSFLAQVPATYTGTIAVTHPLLDFYKSRIAISDRQLKYIKTLKYPTFSLFGVLQTRGSGFSSQYVTDQTAYTHSYLDGIKPSRTNYLFGVGVTWNLTSLLRIREQERSQAFTSKALQEEYNTIALQLSAQQSLAEMKVTNAIAAFNEAPVQLKAASDAYLQKSVLYKNGLSNIIDVTQTLYSLNRAEANRDIAFSNVWQSLLIKAAANGDFMLFLNQVK